MLIQLLISMFGIAIVHRILSLLEKTEVSHPVMKPFFYFLQLPFYLALYFKELFTFVLLYIGFFLLILIVFDKIIVIFCKYVFEKEHLYILDRLLLLLKTGKSAQTAAKIVFDDLNRAQKVTFCRLNDVFEISNLKNNEKSGKRQVAVHFYFDELLLILKSNNQVIEQLRAFRAALRIQQSLRHKSRQVTLQCRAQAVVAIFIYFGLMLLGRLYLELQIFSAACFSSLILFLTGQILIFCIGGRIRWKT